MRLASDPAFLVVDETRWSAESRQPIGRTVDVADRHDPRDVREFAAGFCAISSGASTSAAVTTAAAAVRTPEAVARRIPTDEDSIEAGACMPAL